MNSFAPAARVSSVRRWDWYFFARPVLMPPVWTILLLASVPESRVIPLNAIPPGSWRVWSALGVSFLLAGGVYILNQIFDVESDRANRKLRFLPDGIIRMRSATAQYLAFTGLALAGGAVLGRVWLAGSVAVALLGVFYSVPVVRLKDRPFGGLVANALGHGTLVYYLGQALGNPHAIPPWGGSISYAFAVAGVYLLTTIPDRNGDALTGKRTMAVRFGSRTTAAVALVCVLVAGFAALWYHQWPVALSAGVSVPWFALTVAIGHFSGTAVRVALLALSFFACLAFWPYAIVLAGVFISTRWYYRRRFGMQYPRFGGGG